MVKFRFIILIIVLLVSSCSLFKKDFYDNHPCINQQSKNVLIEWGYYLSTNKKLYGFRLDTKGKLYLIDKDNYDGKLLLTLSLDEYCELYSGINQEILKTQTLNVPRDTNTFIMLKNPDIKYTFRALWDPNYETVGSEGFRELFKKLNKYLPPDPNGNKIYHNFEFID